MNNRQSPFLEQAVVQGLLPAEVLEATASTNPHPWPLVLFSFFGAQLAALPLIVFVFLLFGSFIEHGAGPYLICALFLAGSVLTLRGRQRILFVQNMALVALFVGIGLLCFGLVRDIHNAGYLFSALASLALAYVVPVNWVRSLLGALAAGLCLGIPPEGVDTLLRWEMVTLAETGVWLAALWVQRHHLANGQYGHAAIALERLASGWIFLILVIFALSSGMGFMADGVLGSRNEGTRLARDIAETAIPLWFGGVNPFSLISSAAGLASLAWGWPRLPALRSPAGVGLFVVLTCLAWFMPTFGPTILVATIAFATGRRFLAGAALLTATWILGSFYYTLQWSLISKAQILIGAALILGVLAWTARPRIHTPSAGAFALPPSNTTCWIGLGFVGTLAMLCMGVWQKEAIIAHGKPVFVKLVPVDPRSLMQGDYMALDYDMTPELRAALGDTTRVNRPHVLARLDAQDVATLETASEALPSSPDMLRIELTPKNGRWVLVSDAWFFREGDGERWRKARYGEFRVMPDGKALLVGLADEHLVRLGKR